MKEEEAKERWCPFSRLLSHTYSQDGQGRTYEGGYSYNRSPDDEELYIPSGAYCIGSACMAWRWQERVERTTTLKEGEPAPGPEWVMDGEAWDADPNKVLSTPQRLQRWRVPDAGPQGFCGLAGGGQP